jgi:hypothetical protein
MEKLPLIAPTPFVFSAFRIQAASPQQLSANGRQGYL